MNSQDGIIPRYIPRFRTNLSVSEFYYLIIGEQNVKLRQRRIKRNCYRNIDCGSLVSEKEDSFASYISVISTISTNFNAADIIGAIVCLGLRDVSIRCHVTSKNRCVGKSCLSMVHHKARYWRPILHKSLIIRLRPCRCEKLCVKNIFSRQRHDSNVRDRKLSEAALR